MRLDVLEQFGQAAPRATVDAISPAWLYARFLRHRSSFADLDQWQIAYLPAYAVVGG